MVFWWRRVKRDVMAKGQGLRDFVVLDATSCWLKIEVEMPHHAFTEVRGAPDSQQITSRYHSQ
jgi:hypothetical protein